jgi:hypothetical protein
MNKKGLNYYYYHLTTTTTTATIIITKFTERGTESCFYTMRWNECEAKSLYKSNQQNTRFNSILNLVIST